MYPSIVIELSAINIPLNCRLQPVYAYLLCKSQYWDKDPSFTIPNMSQLQPITHRRVGGLAGPSLTRQ